MTKLTTETSPTDVAWAAGLLEGEGCFSICHRKSAKWDHKTVAVHCEMTDEDTIQKLLSVFKVGTINQRLSMKRNDGRIRKDTWIWSVQNHSGIELVLKSVHPYLSKRRTQKAEELLEYIEKRKSNLGDT